MARKKRAGEPKTKKKKEEVKPKKAKIQGPTVGEILSDKLTELSLQYWAPLGDLTEEEVQRQPFNADIIEDIYKQEIKEYKIDRIMLLEVSHYLENYLWKNFDPQKSSFAHLMSILAMVNEKFREGVEAWECFHSREEIMPSFFERIWDMKTQEKLSQQEQLYFITFLIHCFQSFEDAVVRKECMKLVSLPLWNALNPERLKRELKALPKLAKHWNALKQREKKESNSRSHEKTFIPNLIKEFLEILESMNQGLTQPGPLQVRYCERFLEFLLDLISQLPTRRFFHPVLQDSHVIVKSRMSVLPSLTEGRLFKQLLDMLKFFDGFEVNDYTGEEMSEDDMNMKHAQDVQQLQRIAFKDFPELKSLALGTGSSIETRDSLLQHFKVLSDARLRELAVQLALLAPAEGPTESREFLEEILCSRFEKRMPQVEIINEMPLYPTEEVMWDDNLIPTDEYTGEHCLALPKLNLQFLTFNDYLLRNFDLFRLESAYEIRGDLEDAVERCNPRKEPASGKTTFLGWSRMALPIKEFSITRVGRPKLGETNPSEVIADVVYSIQPFKGQFRNEWDSLKQHDILFLVTVRPTVFVGDALDPNLPFLQKYGVQYIRGCEILEMFDEDDHLIKDFEQERAPRKGNIRTARVALDPSQYHLDVENIDEDVYGSFNLLIRRKPKENNFKAVLETIRDLMNTQTVVPEWLHDLLLGYGDPTSGQSSEETLHVDFNDTFLNINHLKASFPDQKLVTLDTDGKPSTEAPAPYKLEFAQDKVVARAYRPEARGPYPHNVPKKNAIPFTPTQVNGIKSAMGSGLTLIVGPPGTGKTDVAVQIISNWYHNFPQQRILLVTHSNQALNQLFEKIMALDIDERHLLRLGHGEEMLDTGKDFSKFGRVNYMLGRRLELLEEVDKLGKSLAVGVDVAYTCETAEHFYYSHVLALWERFTTALAKEPTVENISKLFPFAKYFANAPQPLFKGASYEEDKLVVDSCWRYLTSIFTMLQECRAFELLRTNTERANYLVTKHSKIIAMTCTHAALKRHDLVSLGFKFDNLLMEEAAQILEIETFIPMLLQDHDRRQGNRLKRVVLIGDHHQLPPIIKNIAFQKYAHLDQSLFARFVRLGVPTIDLDSQGRSRPSIAKLYNWRYKQLLDLPVVHSEIFTLANAGFRFEYQVIDVPDWKGKGEVTPTPFFYQNLAEAEYVACMFMYMRLLGYPAESISVLTTYNGQKHLLREVIASRTAWNPRFFGKPKKITTVDRYQGQQNDYVLLSLVRTKAVGHLRDVRRLVVAMSRARLGLYVFCRLPLFQNCYELTQTFAYFLQRPSKLHIVSEENFPTKRKLEEDVPMVEIEDFVQLGGIVNSMSSKVAEEMKRQMEEEQKLAQEQLEAAASAMETETTTTTTVTTTTIAVAQDRIANGTKQGEQEEEDEEDE